MIIVLEATRTQSTSGDRPDASMLSRLGPAISVSMERQERLRLLSLDWDVRDVCVSSSALA